MSPSRARLRSVAGVASLALAAASMSVVATGAAQADGPTPTGAAPSTLTWLVNDYVHVGSPAGQFTGPVVGDGASADATTGAVTFVAGAGRTDLKTHETTVTYAGSAKFSSSHGGDASYSVTLSNPTVEVDAAGDGTLSADLAWTAQGTEPGTAQDVELTSFTAGEAQWDGYALTATPDWTGEVPADTYGTGKPVGGASWALGFVTSIPSSIRPFFYASGSSSDAKKAPAPFEAVVPGPSVSVTGGTFGPSQVSYQVAGSGFTPVLAGGPPADDGVYVGLAPSGGLPDVSSPSGQEAFAAASWVGAGAVTGGAFSTVLSTTPDKLTPGTAYSVYTWKAHSPALDPDGTQTTETPVDVDWAALQPHASSVVVGGATSTTFGKAAVVTATVPDRGTVTLTGLGAAQTRTLAGAGTATFTVPATLAAGRHTATIAYSGGGDHAAKTSVSTFVVAKAGTRTRVRLAARPTTRKAGRAAVTVAGARGGKVVVTVKGAGRTAHRTVRLTAAGRGTVALPRAARGGSFVVTVRYAGDANHRASSARTTYKVAKPRTSRR